MKLHIRIRIGRPSAAQPDSVPFRSFAKGTVPRIWTLVGSVALHVSMVLMLTVVSRELSAWMKDDQIDWSRYQVEPLRLHLVQPLVYRAENSGQQDARQRVTRPKTPGGSQKARGLRTYVPNQLELPPPQEAATTLPVIVQPEIRPQTVPPDALPPLAFWARQRTPVPPGANDVVVPGRTEPSSAGPDLASTPSPVIPNREQSAADINFSSAKTQASTTPTLPVANSATNPVRVRDRVGARAASFEQFAGQPANVLVMAAQRPEIADVRIPRGLRNIPPATGGDDTGTVRGEAEPPAGAIAGSTPNGTNGADAGRAVGAAPSGHVGSNATSTAPERVKAGSSREDPRRLAETTVAHPPESSGITRIAHPSKGRFDVVIMQSPSANDELSEATGVLTGSPVYTVYLQVGDRREWLMEYCLPSGQNLRTSYDSAPITPPYPISTAIPNDILAQSITSHIVIHGFLTAGGSLSNVAVPNTGSPLAARILALLDEWRFRPALRKNEPIQLEVLLIVPARS